MQKKRDRPNRTRQKNKFSLTKAFGSIGQKLKRIDLTGFFKSFGSRVKKAFNFKAKAKKTSVSPLKKSSFKLSSTKAKVITVISTVLVLVAGVSLFAVIGSSGGGEGGSSSAGGSPSVPKPITVYFENNWLWSDVRCYYWPDDGSAWPGVEMTLAGYSDGHEVYSATIPANVEGIIFNGNKNEDPNTRDQSPDITEGIKNGATWKMNWTGGNTVTSVEFNPKQFVVPTIAIAPPSLEKDNRVHFYVDVPPVRPLLYNHYCYAYYDDGQSVVEPEAPSYEGYNFIGWYDDVMLGEKVSFPYSNTKEHGLYARYEKIPEYIDPVVTNDTSVTFDKTYRITFYVGGEQYAVAGAESGDYVNAPPDPELEGHIFVSWIAPIEGYNPSYTFPLQVNGHYSIYALFEADSSFDDGSDHEHNFVNGECECGEKDPNYIPPHEHVYVNGQCSCGEKDPDLENHEHNYSSIVTLPTCTEPGAITYSCSCGDSYSIEDDPATGHSIVNGVCQKCGFIRDVTPIRTNNFTSPDTDYCVRFYVIYPGKSEVNNFAYAGFNEGQRVLDPLTSPSCEGYLFYGWYTHPTEGELVQFPYVGRNKSVYARFVERVDPSISFVGTWKFNQDVTPLPTSNGYALNFNSKTNVFTSKSFSTIRCYIASNGNVCLEYLGDVLHFAYNSGGLGSLTGAWIDSSKTINITKEPTSQILKYWLLQNATKQ